MLSALISLSGNEILALQKPCLHWHIKNIERIPTALFIETNQ